MTQPGMLDVGAAATYLGVNERYVRLLVSERRITFYKIGRLVRFQQEDLDAFLANGRVPRREEAS